MARGEGHLGIASARPAEKRQLPIEAIGGLGLDAGIS